ncbi:Histone deacetylase complex subunit SAP130-A-like protein, partial [Dinothrombium tinctorium]
MPATCATCSSTCSTTTTTSSQQQNAANNNKVENVKQIGICVAPALQQSTAVCAANKFATTVSANYYQTSVSSTTGVNTTASIPVASLQSLGLMVTRFANDPSSRQQTVILHPRPVNPTARGANVVVTTSTGAAIAPGAAATLRTVTTVPLSNTAVRAQQQQVSQQNASQPSTIQVMNLSVSNPTSNASQSHQQATVKQICPPTGGRFNITNALPLESLELVVTNDSATGRPIRIHPEVNFVNMKSTNASNTSLHNMAKLTRASVVTTQQPTKMINIHGASAGTLNAGTTQQVTRLGIIGQIPSSAVVTTAGGNKPVINTLTLTKPLQILNPSPNVAPNLVNSGNTTVHSVVSVSNVASFASGIGANAQQNQQKPNQTLMTLTTSANLSQTRHTLITSNSGVQNALSHQSRTATNTTSTTSSSLTVQHYNPQQQHVSLSAPLSTTTSTSLRPNILSSPANSPVKQSQVQQQSTPSSPRPSILIRKRVGNEVNQVSNAYKQPMANTTPTKVLNVASTDSLKTMVKNSEAKEEANRANDSMSKTGPSTPNSDATGATPRKKPRKQLLEPFNLTTSQNIKLLNAVDDNKEKKEERDLIDSKEGIITICKKPRPSLLTPYNVGCKSLQYHFLRYSDVRQKSEKKLTLSELSNEGLQRKNGWKIHHLGTQLDDISDNEAMICERLSNFLNKFERNGTSLPNNITVVGVTTLNNSGRTPTQVSVIDKLSDLIRGNLQRSHLFQEQICESKELLVKLTNDHKERVAKLTR